MKKSKRYHPMVTHFDPCDIVTHASAKLNDRGRAVTGSTFTAATSREAVLNLAAALETIAKEIRANIAIIDDDEDPRSSF